MFRSAAGESRRGQIAARATYRTVATLSAAYAATGGLVTLTGWLFHIPRFTDWGGDGISMQPNTAFCAMLAGVALFLVVRAPQATLGIRVLGGVVTAIGFLTVFEHLTGVNLGIDALLVPQTGIGAASAATVAPGRMGPPASTSFTIIGTLLALSTGGMRARRLTAFLALIPLAIAALGLVGYVYGASQLYAVARITGVALQTASMIAALGVGIIAAVPEHGITALLRRDDAGSLVFRRLIIPVLGWPFLIGFLRLEGQRAGLFDMAFGSAAVALATMIAFFALLWWTANGMSRYMMVVRRAEQSLREADRRKDEFLATLAHELRGPLAPMRNSLEIMKRADGQPGLLERSRRMVEQHLDHLVRLVDDLMDVSRLTFDKLELRRAPIDLRAVLEQAIETSLAGASRAGLELQADLPRAPVLVEGDRQRLVQVFGNLLSNACKFTPRGGTIQLSVAQRTTDVVVSVSDTGIGIAPDVIPTIFGMFAQGDQRIEHAQRGLGIGLALSQRLVQMHGGELTAHSDGEGKGSTFSVRLPLLEKQTGHPAGRPVISSEG